MTIEQDIERVQQVTAALAGPEKVWVMVVDSDDSGILGVTAFGTIQAALDEAIEDMREHKYPKKVIDTAIAELGLKHETYIQIDGVTYHLSHVEVKT